MPVVADVTTELIEVLDHLCETDPAVMADGETIEWLHRQLARLEAATTRAVAAFDARRDWEADGARSAAAWITTRCHLPSASAQRRVRLGRELRHLAVVEAAWLAGDITASHVDVLAAARTPATAECFARDEQTLVDAAAQLRFRPFQRAVAYWSQLADPDGVEHTARDGYDTRRLHLSQSFNGAWFLDGCLDPVGGTAFATGLNRIEQELFEADWADARDRLGDQATASDLARTPAQRRADAAVEMARRAGAVPADARMPEPLFTVLVGYETFAGRICELANGTVVTPGSLVRWLTDAWIERVVFDSPDRIKNVGVKQRLFTGATRRAVEVRDRECFHDYCDLTAENCQIDHIQPYATGGPTTDHNGRPACSFHNRQRHRRRP